MYVCICSCECVVPCEKIQGGFLSHNIFFFSFFFFIFISLIFLALTHWIYVQHIWDSSEMKETHRGQLMIVYIFETKKAPFASERIILAIVYKWATPLPRGWITQRPTMGVLFMWHRLQNVYMCVSYVCILYNVCITLQNEFNLFMKIMILVFFFIFSSYMIILRSNIIYQNVDLWLYRNRHQVHEENWHTVIICGWINNWVIC